MAQKYYTGAIFSQSLSTGHKNINLMLHEKKDRLQNCFRIG